MAGSGQGKITVQRLEAALETVAGLLLIDEFYLPIFERLEVELANALKAENTLERARAMARRAQAQGSTR